MLERGDASVCLEGFQRDWRHTDGIAVIVISVLDEAIRLDDARDEIRLTSAPSCLPKCTSFADSSEHAKRRALDAICRRRDSRSAP